LIPFFRLTSDFFGLTSEYKIPLLEEIYICTQHLKGLTYSDVLSMPVYERRYFLSLLSRDIENKKEYIENAEISNQNKNAKGNRTSKISGEALKTKIKNGLIPNS